MPASIRVVLASLQGAGPVEVGLGLVRFRHGGFRTARPSHHGRVRDQAEPRQVEERGEEWGRGEGDWPGEQPEGRGGRKAFFCAARGPVPCWAIRARGRLRPDPGSSAPPCAAGLGRVVYGSVWVLVLRWRWQQQLCSARSMT